MPGTVHKADVLIVGAGPSGSTLAALLASRGLDVLLTDRAQFPREKTCGDGLTPRAIPVLERLGVLPQLEAAGYQRILGAQLFPADSEPWTLSFADYDVGLPHHGLVVPRYDLDHLLLNHALAEGARFLPGFSAHAPMRAGNSAVVGVSGELEGAPIGVSARLTVLAVGAHIGLLRMFGLLRKMPPGIKAIRGYFSGVPHLGPYFEFYFEPELAPGYAWVFPLADGRANIGLGVPDRGIDEHPRNLRRLLNEFIARNPQLRDAEATGPLRGFPLRIDFPAYRPVGDGYLLIGESLGLVNPITGEGIDLALESGELAAPHIESALALGDVTRRSLAPYERSLNARYGNFFRGVKILRRVATSPRAMRVIVRQAKKKPRLARLVAGINLGVASPWQAFSPLTWWDLLT